MYRDCLCLNLEGERGEDDLKMRILLPAAGLCVLLSRLFACKLQREWLQTNLAL